MTRAKSAQCGRRIHDPSLRERERLSEDGDLKVGVRQSGQRCSREGRSRRCLDRGSSVRIVV
jgi:hypothetical protein